METQPSSLQWNSTILRSYVAKLAAPLSYFPNKTVIYDLYNLHEFSELHHTRFTEPSINRFPALVKHFSTWVGVHHWQGTFFSCFCLVLSYAQGSYLFPFFPEDFGGEA